MKIYFIWVGWEKLYKLNYNIPPLGVLRVAGETPPTIPISFTDETVSPINYESDADIVALSFLTPAAGRAYEIAARFRQLGKYIVVGGTHATIMPEQCAEYADTVVIGGTSAALTAVDATAGTLTLDAPVSFEIGMPVAFPSAGKGPDYGAVEAGLDTEIGSAAGGSIAFD